MVWYDGIIEEWLAYPCNYTKAWKYTYIEEQLWTKVMTLIVIENLYLILNQSVKRVLAKQSSTKASQSFV